MRLDEVEAKSGFKRVHIYSLMKKGEFPQALRLGVRAVDWDSTEADVWISERPRTGCDRLAAFLLQNTHWLPYASR